MMRSITGSPSPVDNLIYLGELAAFLHDAFLGWRVPDDPGLSQRGLDGLKFVLLVLDAGLKEAVDAMI
jgi:hypothetical protein